VTNAERTAEMLTDLRSIASTSVLRDDLPLAQEILLACENVAALGKQMGFVGVDDRPFIRPPTVPAPARATATKGAVLASVAEDLKLMAQAFIADGHDRLAHSAVRCASGVRGVIETAQTLGVDGNLMLLASLMAEHAGVASR